MSYLNGYSLLSGIQTGLTSAYSSVAGLYDDGVTQANLTTALSDSTFLMSTYGTSGSSFASYLSSNFSLLDSDSDGTLSSSEISTLTTQMSSQGMTRDQITSLGGLSGMSTETQGMVLENFSAIDTNNDGYVSAGEIQAYNLTSKLEKQKVEDVNKMVQGTSLFYGTSDKEFSSSLVSYKWVTDDDE